MPVLIPVIGAIGGFVGSIVGTIGGLVGGFTGLISFLTSPIGALILGIGLQLVIGPLLAKKQAPSAEAGKVNVRIAEAERWIVCGTRRQGGAIVFGEFDAVGQFWYVIIHSDSLVGPISQRYFDDVPISIDGSGDVTTDEFCFDDELNVYSGTGTRHPFFRIWTQTHSEAVPTPPAVAALAAAFPGASGWTADHKLIGTTYSVVRMLTIAPEHRHKAYKWRGPIGIGEPSLSIVGQWSKVYDPNAVVPQINGDASTYLFSKNAVLVWAWFRTHRYGRNKPRSSINWDMVAEQALIAAQPITDLNTNIAPRYNCSIAIPDSKQRSDAEQEILATMDAQLVFDDDGKCWPRVGYYYAPTLVLTRNRDIVGMESVEAQNGESETNGVIVRFTDPAGKYLAQPSAPWVNPLYYVPGELPKYLTVDVLGIENHNQAMRIAKAIGMRSQSAYKILPTVGLRGLKMRQERIVDILYDNTFAGNHEIVTPVEVDKVGIFCGAGMVPVDADRWTLLSGEEKQPPVYVDAGVSLVPVLPTPVTITYANNQIRAAFPLPPRLDIRYVFEIKKTADTVWQPMSVDMIALVAIAYVGTDNQEYQIRYKAVLTSGRASAWITPIPTIVASVIIISGTPVLTGQVGVAYAGFTVTASGGIPPRTFANYGGGLPPGITINTTTGVVAGTPTVAGTYSNIILRAVDADLNFNYLPPFTITIAP